MSIQSKIANATANADRKLFDYKVFQSGTEVQVTRLKVSKNKYEDVIQETFISKDKITIVLSNYESIPLNRLRTDLASPVVKTTSTFMYDILPIEGFTQFSDRLEKDDIIIQEIFDENAETPAYYLVLRVTDVLGSIKHGNIVWKKFICAPYDREITSIPTA